MPQAWQSRKHPVCGPEDLQVAWQERVAPLSAAPPYTKTPLFIELASVKQQLAALADENVRLSGFSRELTETCNHLSCEVRRVKSAFGALMVPVFRTRDIVTHSLMGLLLLLRARLLQAVLLVC